ncbi:hypothetical protein [Rhodospira trueperi]|uniref:Sortilin, neurotensin receptor 3 n=1 Tax=Rhodospira trueperi TaxID=69960 RepID=A0A1G6XXM5_9PROT|nr:hypothetical protein [Rhodospira trueperi]SDD82187.1 hypothetical protein SAMN05421720_101654 [Rhodospira trueperi]
MSDEDDIALDEGTEEQDDSRIWALKPDDERARTEAERRALTDLDLDLVATGAYDRAADPAFADAQSAALTWAPRGPRNVGGRIRAMVQDPAHPDTFYAGSSQGGVWKTTNRGDTWTPLTGLVRANKEVAVPVGALGLCERSPQHLYVATGALIDNPTLTGIGLFYTDDGGDTFRRLVDETHGGNAFRRFSKVLVDPWEPRRAWCASEDGLFRTEPGVSANDPPQVQAIADTNNWAGFEITDVAIDFGGLNAATRPAKYTVYAAVKDDGVYRAIFDWATQTYDPVGGNTWNQVFNPFDHATDPDRILFALCASQPDRLYCVFSFFRRGVLASRVFRSDDSGATWNPTPANRRRTGVHRDGDQSFHAFVLEVCPRDPDVVVAGSVDLYASHNGGGSWAKIMDWEQYDLGDRAQHADQHEVLFERSQYNDSTAFTGADAGNPREIWVGNDGGVSQGQTDGANWRKRSHGILATQYYDIQVHPDFPFIRSAGFQDNGTWMGFGGPSWHHMGGGDGGGSAFYHGDIQRILLSWQGNVGDVFSLVDVRPETRPLPLPNRPRLEYRNSLPDVAGLGPTEHDGPFRITVANQTNRNRGFRHSGVFGGRVIHHPTTTPDFLVARAGAAYRSTDGIRFNRLTGAGANNPANLGGNDVTAIAYSPASPDTHWWIGTEGSADDARLFRTTDGGASWLRVDNSQMSYVADVSGHPTRAEVAAVALSRDADQVYVTPDSGATWHEIARSGTAPDNLPETPVTTVRFDPNSPNDLSQPQTLYVGTGAGVFVARDVDLSAPVPKGTWRHLNTGMPLVTVQDLHFVPVLAEDGSVARHLLLCATYGRGLYECALDGTPSVRLFMRSTVIDDGTTYQNTQAAVTVDPRIRMVTTDATEDLHWHRAFDLRVDSADNFDFGDSFDGAEFDERFRSGILNVGRRNRIFVQIHTAGFSTVDGIDLRLYFANAEPPAPGQDPQAPDLDAGFWDTFPAPPPDGSVWQLAGQATVDGVDPSTPRVVGLPWTPPGTLGQHAALLAVITHPDDDLTADGPGLVVDARADPSALSRTERRVALRVVGTDTALAVPDGLDDADLRLLAWGGRSTAIRIADGPLGDPEAALAGLPPDDPTLPATGGRHVYVAVGNRRQADIEVEVQLFAAPYPGFAVAADWTDLGRETFAVPAGERRFTPAGFALNDAGTMVPGPGYRALTLMALVEARTEDGARILEAMPDVSGVTDLASFWRLFGRHSGWHGGGSATLLAVRVTG